MKYLYLLFFGLFILLNGGASAQKFRFTPPESFVQDSAKLPNYLWTNKNAGSVIQIAVSENTPYSAYSVAIHDSVFVAQNLIVKEKKEIFVQDQNHRKYKSALFICSYMAVSDDASKNIEFTRVICFTGDDSMTLMAVATIPTMAESVLLEPVLQSFKNQLILQK